MSQFLPEIKTLNSIIIKPSLDFVLKCISESQEWNLTLPSLCFPMHIFGGVSKTK